MSSASELRCAVVPHWPPLAWLARCEANSHVVEVRHGARVEVKPDWFCEAAWAGDYETGGFDRTDIVAGSGGTVRNGHVVFVSSGSTVDRLHSLVVGSEARVSNSLACLVASVDADVDPRYPRYFADFNSVVEGLQQYKRVLPTTRGPVQLTYFENLVWDGRRLRAEPKPDQHASFKAFADYRTFLDTSMRAIAANATSAARRHPYRLLSTLSGGYDSTTVTTLARPAGLEEAITFESGDTRNRDTGEEAAKHLGVRLTVVPRQAWQVRPLAEVPFITANSFGEEVHFSGAEELLGGRLVLTGFHGDKVWGKETQELSPDLVRGDLSGLGLCEYRLWAGFLHCPVPFWGVRRIRDLHAISLAPEMRPWDIPGWYSRPICRRIVEEAGVPRGTFARGKAAASVWHHQEAEFLTPRSMADYLAWVRRRVGSFIPVAGLPVPPNLWLDRVQVASAHSIMKKMARLVGLRGMWRLKGIGWINRLHSLTWASSPQGPWIPPLRRHVFPWALEHAVRRYRD